MCLLIETIRIENGLPSLLEFHQERMTHAQKNLLDLKEPVNLVEYLASQTLPKSGVWKCRITYQKDIEKIEFEPYYMKQIQSLKIVEANDFIYDYKFAKREGIIKLFNQRGNADDILIIRNSLITDTSYCNVALWDGSNWFTPLLPLLKGVRRESLIRLKQIQAKDISVTDLKSFESIKLFNAMISFEEAIEIPISAIIF